MLVFAALLLCSSDWAERQSRTQDKGRHLHWSSLYSSYSCGVCHVRGFIDGGWQLDYIRCYSAPPRCRQPGHIGQVSQLSAVLVFTDLLAGVRIASPVCNSSHGPNCLMMHEDVSLFMSHAWYHSHVWHCVCSSPEHSDNRKCYSSCRCAVRHIVVCSSMLADP